MNEAELRGAEVELLMRRLSERFSIRLGLDGGTLADGHQALVRSIFKEKKAAFPSPAREPSATG